MKKLHFQKLRVKNLTSIGDQFIEIPLDTHKTSVITGQNGAAKCLGKGTPVLMADFKVKPVEEIVEGDRLMGDDGTVRTVLSTTKGVSDLYEIQQNRAMNYVVNSSHIMTLLPSKYSAIKVKSPTNPHRFYRLTGSLPIDIPLDDFLSLQKSHQRHLYGFKAVMTNRRLNNFFEPWLAGFYCVSGVRGIGQVKIRNTEGREEIIKKLILISRKYHWKKEEYIPRSSVADHFFHIYESTDFEGTEFLQEMTKHRIIGGSKEIPRKIAYYSYQERLEFLAGVLDACGGRNDTSYSINREMFQSKGFRNLLMSLGISYSDLTTTKAQRVNIFGNVHEIPVVGIRPCHKANSNKSTSSINVVPLGKGEYYGFSVDGNGRFCLADGTTTHNSSIIDALSFGLYGSPFRSIKIGDLVNNVNQKDMQVELTFLKGKDQYEIKRGYKKQFLEVYKNGEKLPSSIDLKSHLEENILGVNKQTFSSLIALSKANYTPIIQLPIDKRRLFVESLLDISVYRDMLDVHKEEVKRVKNDLSFKEHDYSRLTKQLEQAKQFVLDLKQEQEVSSSNQEQELKEAIEKAKEEYETFKKKYKTIPEQMEEAKSLIADKNTFLRKANKAEAKAKADIQSMKKEISFMKEHDHCPTCTQEISSSFKEDYIKEKSSAVSELEGKLVKVLNKRERVEDEVSIAENNLNNLQALYFQEKQLLANLKQAESNLDKFLSQSSKNDSSALKKAKSSLKDIFEERKELEKEIEELKKEQEIHTLTSSLLSDTGIKAIIIKKYLPLINNLINKNLQKLGLFATLTFDEEFKETLKKRGFDDFSYNQLSEGEKLRVDLAIMMAWRELASYKSNVSTNLLMLDEIFNTSMDIDGCQKFMSMLNSLEDTNTFIISPNVPQELMEMSQQQILLEKKEGFSTVQFLPSK